MGAWALQAKAEAGRGRQLRAGASGPGGPASLQQALQSMPDSTALTTTRCRSTAM